MTEKRNLGKRLAVLIILALLLLTGYQLLQTAGGGNAVYAAETVKATDVKLYQALTKSSSAKNLGSLVTMSKSKDLVVIVANCDAAGKTSGYNDLVQAVKTIKQDMSGASYMGIRFLILDANGKNTSRAYSSWRSDAKPAIETCAVSGQTYYNWAKTNFQPGKITNSKYFVNSTTFATKPAETFAAFAIRNGVVQGVCDDPAYLHAMVLNYLPNSEKKQIDSTNYFIAVTTKGKAVAMPRDLAKAKVTVQDQLYTGSALRPAPTVLVNGIKIPESNQKDGKTVANYTVYYSNNFNVGTATVTIYGKGEFHGKAEVNFQVLPLNIAAAKVSGVEGNRKEGQARRAPTLTMQIGGKDRLLVKGTDYTYKYQENPQESTVTLIATGKGNFTGTLKKTFADGGILRLYGDNRYKTSYAIAEQLLKELGVKQFSCALIASGENDKYPDALSGAYLAKLKKAPILATRTSEIPTTISFLKRYVKTGSTVYILGGTGSVDASLERQLQNAGFKAKRLGGKNRYETNLLILKEANVTTQDVIVCTGAAPGDSLSASATGKPIFLVDTVKLRDEQVKYLNLGTVRPRRFYLVGDRTVIPAAAQTELSKHAPVQRIGGKDVYARSLNIARQFFRGRQTYVALAPGNETAYPDGLCGGPLAAAQNAPLILCDNSSTVATNIRTYTEPAYTYQLTVFGGATWISEATARKIIGWK